MVYPNAHTLSEQRPEKSSDAAEVCRGFGLSSSLPRLFLPRSEPAVLSKLLSSHSNLQYATIARNQLKTTKGLFVQPKYPQEEKP